eukprot:4094245-Amphidinium_carterae.2
MEIQTKNWISMYGDPGMASSSALKKRGAQRFKQRSNVLKSQAVHETNWQLHDDVNCVSASSLHGAFFLGPSSK